MNKVIDSVCGGSESFQAILERIVTSVVALEQEKQIARVMGKAFEEHGQYPTREFICRRFGLELEQGPTLSQVDLQVHWDEKDAERLKVRSSSILQEASVALLEEGADQDKIKAEIEEALKSRTGAHIDIRDSDEISLSEMQDRPKPDVTYRFGIEDLDSLVMGIEPGTATTIGGYVGSFKTTYAISMAVGNAINGASSAILTLEMPSHALKAQALSNFSFTPAYEGQPLPYLPIIKQRLSPDEREDLLACEAAYRNLPGKIKVFNGSSVSPDLLTGLPLGCKALADMGIRALYIDHVQLLKYYTVDTEKVTGVDRFVKTMTDVAVDLAAEGFDFRVIFLSQIGREPYKRALRRGGQYDLTAMAEYNELERSSAYMVTLFSTDELKAVNEIRIQLLKHRLGATLEEPTSVYVDPTYSTVGGVSAMSDFDATTDEVQTLLGDDFGF